MLKQCVINAYPNEACGLIFGSVKQIEKQSRLNDYIIQFTARNFSCIESDKESGVAFYIENIEKLHEAVLSQRYALNLEKNIRIISIFHSHPSGSHPSSIDKSNMKFLDDFSSSEQPFVSKAFKNQIWTIMDASNYNINAFLYFNGEFLQIELNIVD